MKSGLGDVAVDADAVRWLNESPVWLASGVNALEVEDGVRRARASSFEDKGE